MPKKERVAQKEAAAGAQSAKSAAEREAREAAEWADEGLNKKAAAKAAEAAKAAQKLRDKAEAERLVRAETESAEKQKLRGSEKVAKRQTDKAATFAKEKAQAEAPVLVASGIDGALALLTIAEEGSGSAAAAGGGGPEETAAEAANRDVARAQKLMLAQAGGLVDPTDKHPEKRMKAAYERYEERELPKLREENPSLKRSQLLEVRAGGWRACLACAHSLLLITHTAPHRPPHPPCSS